MTTTTIEDEFRARVSSQVTLEAEGLDRYRVFTPFQFDDGDHLGIVLKKEGERWVLSDEGRTYMQLSYFGLDERDLQRGTRQEIISAALSSFSVQDRDGELLITVPEGRYGDALYSFVQALLKISDVTYLTRERARSTFMSDLRALVASLVPAEDAQFDWHDPVHDQAGDYTVDCRINGRTRPRFLYGLPTDDRTRDATIALLRLETWGVPHHSIGVFENQESIARKVLARFSDVCDKQFSNLQANRDRIAQYLREAT